MENKTESNPRRRRCIGLIGGALWLIGISAFFIIWSLIVIATTWAIQVLVVSAVIIVVLIVIGAAELRAALRLPKSSAAPAQEEQKIGRRFAWVFGAEVLAFIVVNSIFGAMERYELLPSLNLIIVGIHFFPLAKIFHVPRYYITGLLFCIIPVSTLLAIPKESLFGNTLAWYVIPSIGCGIVAIITAVAGFYEAWKSISKSST